ncbi:MAG: hypothetical protein IPM18_17315 [Phycisphaerales bacterium]|nr:hypothetical protein [Phycisphaerales bacterium]
MKCKPWPSATILLVVVAALSVTGAWSRADDRGPLKASELGIDLSTFAPQRAMVEAELTKDESGRFTRADLLAMLGRSSAASGNFELSAAAYVTFLDEFGADHPYSEQVALRLIDSLAPLDTERSGLGCTSHGPEFMPAWKGDVVVERAQVARAVQVCEYICNANVSATTKRDALLRVGWLHRALGDWVASTRAWDRCADAGAGTATGARARWLAAENLELLGDVQGGVSRLRLLLKDGVTGARATAIERRIAQLELEARWGAQEGGDPIDVLQQQISAASTADSPQRMYRLYLDWLRRRGDAQAQARLAQWALTQSTWSNEMRAECGRDLALALAAESAAPRDAKRAAAVALQVAIGLEPNAERARRDGFRRIQLLRESGDIDEATRELAGLRNAVPGDALWEPLLLAEMVRLAVAKRDFVDAADALRQVRSKYPELPTLAELDALLSTAGEDK